MQLMPSMIENGSGHVINISSIGVLTNAHRAFPPMWHPKRHWMLSPAALPASWPT